MSLQVNHLELVETLGQSSEGLLVKKSRHFQAELTLVMMFCCIFISGCLGGGKTSSNSSGVASPTPTPQPTPEPTPTPTPTPTVPVASALEFVGDLSDLKSGAVLSQFQVKAVDSEGNTVTSFEGDVQISSSQAGSVAGGNLVVKANQGIASFSNVSLSGGLRNLQLIASSSGLTSAGSNSFHVAAFIDRFDGNNGDLTASVNWTTDPFDPTSLVVNSGKVKAPVALQGGNVLASINHANDFFLETEFQGTDVLGSAALVFRTGSYNSIFDANDSYMCFFSSGSGNKTYVSITSLLGSFISFDPVPINANFNIHDGSVHKLGCEVTATNTVKAYIDGNLVSSYNLGSDGNDPGYTTGSYGIFLTGSSSNSLDNFVVTDSN